MGRKFKCIRLCHGFRDQLFNDGDIVYAENHELDHPTLKAHFKPIGGSPVVDLEEESEEEDIPMVDHPEVEKPKKGKKGKPKGELDGTQAEEDQVGPASA